MSTAVGLTGRLTGGNEKRIRAAAEWRRLVGQPRSVVEPALRHPSDGLACKRLTTLFGVTSHQRLGIIPKIGRVKLRRALVKVAAAEPGRRLLWGPDMRLRELSAA